MFKRFAYAVLAVYAFLTGTADASFHDWRIDQIFSDSTGKVQYIQLGEVTDPGENFLAGQVLSSNAKSFTFPANLPDLDTTGRLMLIGTSSYSKQTGAVTPDYVIPDNFFDPFGDSLNYANVSQFTFTSAQLPKDGNLALNADFSTARNHQKNFLNIEGSISVSSGGGGGPAAIPLPAAVWPGLVVLGGWIANQTRKSLRTKD